MEKNSSNYLLSYSTEYQRAYRNNPKNKEKAKIYREKYRKENKNYFKEHSKKWREENPERYKELLKRWNIKNDTYMKEYYNQPEIKRKARINYQENKEKIKEYHKKPEFRNNNNKSVRKYMQQYPERYTAHKIANYKKLKGTECGLCSFYRYLNIQYNIYITPCLSDESKLCAHHPDYSKPEEIITLCQNHHTELHNNLRESGVEL